MHLHRQEKSFRTSVKIAGINVRKRVGNVIFAAQVVLVVKRVLDQIQRFAKAQIVQTPQIIFVAVDTCASNLNIHHRHQLAQVPQKAHSVVMADVPRAVIVHLVCFVAPTITSAWVWILERRVDQLADGAVKNMIRLRFRGCQHAVGVSAHSTRNATRIRRCQRVVKPKA
jgi:hypothetical protein